MYCDKCGYEFENDNVRFCSQCGKEISPFEWPEDDGSKNKSKTNRRNKGYLPVAPTRPEKTLVALILFFFSLVILSYLFDYYQDKTAETILGIDIVGMGISGNADPTNDEIIEMILGAENLVYEIYSTVYSSGNKVSAIGNTYYLLPGHVGTKELLADYYSQYWIDDTVKRFLNYSCYVFGQYAFPQGNLIPPLDWSYARVVNRKKPDSETMIVDVEIIFEGKPGVVICTLARQYDGWKVKEGPISDIFSESHCEKDIESILWKDGTFIGNVHNNAPDGYGELVRRISVDGGYYRQEMVGHFYPGEEGEEYSFEGTVNVTIPGQSLTVATFTGKNLYNYYLDGTFYFSFLPSNTRLEGSLNTGVLNSDVFGANYFSGKLISGNYINEKYSTKISHASALLGF